MHIDIAKPINFGNLTRLDQRHVRTSLGLK
jgi:hypothetical protein